MQTSEILKDLRISAGYTQKDLSRLLGIGQSTIVGYERGEREATAKILALYADFFNCSVDYLLGREDDFGNIVINSPAAPVLTEEEKRLLTAFRKLVPNMKSFMLANMEMMAAQNG